MKKIEYTSLLQKGKTISTTGMSVSTVTEHKNDVALIQTDYVRDYIDTIGLLLDLSKSSLILLKYMTLRMEKNNVIKVDKEFRDSFNSFMTEKGMFEYSRSTIFSSLNQLVKKEIVFNIQRGVYLVNPVYYDKGSLNERENKIRVLLEFKAGTRPQMFKVY